MSEFYEPKIVTDLKAKVAELERINYLLATQLKVITEELEELSNNAKARMRHVMEVA